MCNCLNIIQTRGVWTLKCIRNEEAAQAHANVISSLFTHYTENNLHFYLTHTDISIVNTCAKSHPAGMYGITTIRFAL